MMDFAENETGEPVCPECGETPDWNECEKCNGDGLITCECEGMGGWLECPYCEDAPLLDYE